MKKLLTVLLTMLMIASMGVANVFAEINQLEAKPKQRLTITNTDEVPEGITETQVYNELNGDIIPTEPQIVDGYICTWTIKSTKNNQVICDKEAHEHTENCYKDPNAEHTHNNNCYRSEKITNDVTKIDNKYYKKETKCGAVNFYYSDSDSDKHTPGVERAYSKSAGYVFKYNNYVINVPSGDIKDNGKHFKSGDYILNGDKYEKHTHSTADCYEEYSIEDPTNTSIVELYGQVYLKTLICTIPEHTHDDSCLKEMHEEHTHGNSCRGTDISITATWKKITYSLVFDLNGGEGTFETLTTDIDDEFKVTAPITEPTRNGYKFIGWYVNECDCQNPECYNGTHTGKQDNRGVTVPKELGVHISCHNGYDYCSHCTDKDGERITRGIASYKLVKFDFTQPLKHDVKVIAKWYELEADTTDTDKSEASEDELKSAYVITDEDYQKLAENNDSKLELELTIKEIEDPSTDLGKIEETYPEVKNLKFQTHDITVVKELLKSDGALISKTDIHELDNSVSIVLDLQDDEVVKPGYARQYHVYRLHEGIAQELDYSLIRNEQGQRQIKFNTNLFSTYAVGYKDVLIPKPAPYVMPKTGIDY